MERPSLTNPFFVFPSSLSSLDCKTVGFFLKISKEIGKAWRKSLTRAKRASLNACRACEAREKNLFLASLPSLAVCFSFVQTFCLTARAYLNTQKYGLLCSLYPLSTPATQANCYQSIVCGPSHVHYMMNVAFQLVIN